MCCGQLASYAKSALLSATPFFLLSIFPPSSIQRMFVVAAALRRGYSVDTLYDLTRIDPWFLNKFKNIIDMQMRLESCASPAATPTNGEARETDAAAAAAAAATAAAAADKSPSGLPLSKDILLEAKKLGFSDKQIAVALAQTEVNVRAFREENGEDSQH